MTNRKGHPRLPATKPPMTGPTPAANATTDVMVPKTLPRTSAGKNRAIRTMMRAGSAEAPAPWIARAAITPG